MWAKVVMAWQGSKMIIFCLLVNKKCEQKWSWLGRAPKWLTFQLENVHKNGPGLTNIGKRLVQWGLVCGRFAGTRPVPWHPTVPSRSPCRLSDKQTHLRAGGPPLVRPCGPPLVRPLVRPWSAPIFSRKRKIHIPWVFPVTCFSVIKRKEKSILEPCQARATFAYTLLLRS